MNFLKKHSYSPSDRPMQLTWIGTAGYLAANPDYADPMWRDNASVRRQVRRRQFEFDQKGGLS